MFGSCIENVDIETLCWTRHHAAGYYRYGHLTVVDHSKTTEGEVSSNNSLVVRLLPPPSSADVVFFFFCIPSHATLETSEASEGQGCRKKDLQQGVPSHSKHPVFPNGPDHVVQTSVLPSSSFFLHAAQVRATWEDFSCRLKVEERAVVHAVKSVARAACAGELSCFVNRNKSPLHSVFASGSGASVQFLGFLLLVDKSAASR